MTYPGIERVQNIELEILTELDRVCKLMNIEYFIIGGTALGAARHQGFIPWDDDIDVGMVRSEYDRFTLQATKKLSGSYFLQTPETDPHTYFPYAKLRRHGTIFSQFNEILSSMHKGIYIDIFPFDNIPDDEQARFTQFKRVKLLTKLFVFRQALYPTRHRVGMVGVILRLARMAVHYLLRLIPKPVLIKALYKNMIKYNNVKTAAVACLFFPKYLVEYANKETLYPLSTIKFCGKNYPCPGDLVTYLKNHYGNYLELPPQNERINHRPQILEFGG